MRRVLQYTFKALYDTHGPQHWWPADSTWEVCCGAVLTQNTSWNNVVIALANLRKADALCPRRILEFSDDELSELIRPSGFFTQKSKRLKILADWFLHKDKKQETWVLREDLLSLHGIGPETADSILLYALDKAVFVIDAYTMRMAQRHWLLDVCDYSHLQNIFMDNLEHDVDFFKEFHALIVANSKTYCRKRFCDEKCPLRTCNFEHQC